jgi:uncharacterized protein
MEASAPMFEAYARWAARRRVAWMTVAAVVILSAVAGFYALRVGQDDDLLKFLPAGNPQVGQFHQINNRFGGTDVAIVGLEAGDPFDAAFLASLAKVTRQLDEEEAIASALSLTNVEDFTPDPEGGIRVAHLVHEPPKNDAEKAALRERVMSLDHVVGTFVSKDGRSVILYCFLAHGVDVRQTAELIQQRVTAAFPGIPAYWGGAPFISSYIYDVTRTDMRKLIPWAVAVIIILIVASFRDLIGAVLAISTAGLGVLMARGLMGLTGVDENIVLSSTPVVLFATSSAYPIHLLARYYELRSGMSCEKAIAHAVSEESRLVLAAGLTTVAGILSFMTMDIEPIRQFGLFTAFGVLATIILSFTLVPAVIRLAELKGRTFGKSAFAGVSVRFVTFVRARRALFGVVLVVATGAAVFFVGQVEARMESAAFFVKGSPPDRAERFLRDEFGGSQFVQVMVEGDMTDPDVLREVQRLADRIAVQPHVSSVQHVGQVLALAFEAMAGERRLPPKTAQVRQLYRLLAGRPALRQLVTDDHQAALLQVKLDTDDRDAVTALLAAMNDDLVPSVPHGYRIAGRVPAQKEPEGEAPPQPPPASEADAKAAAAWHRTVTEARIAAHLHLYGAAIPAGAELDAELDAAEKATNADKVAVERRLADYLRSDESLLEPEQHEDVPALAHALVALGPSPKKSAVEDAVASTLDGDDEDDDEDLADDLARSFMTPLDEVWRQELGRTRATTLLAALGVEKPAGDRGERLELGVAAALLDLGAPSAMVTGGDPDGALAVAVSGAPVLYRGMERSVAQNQLYSLVTSLPVVLIIFLVFFRSLSLSLIGAVPMVVTLLAVYGIMGARHLHLDIGTSMLASILIGDASDYAVHLMTAWRGKTEADLTRATAEAGPGIWTSALTVAAGFWVLTLGEAKPLQNVGGLTALGMVVAAVVTFIAVPVLARRRATS